LPGPRTRLPPADTTGLGTLSRGVAIAKRKCSALSFEKEKNASVLWFQSIVWYGKRGKKVLMFRFQKRGEKVMVKEVRNRNKPKEREEDQRGDQQ
jgi:hypothetical protein